MESSLLDFVKSGGCGCKIDAKQLKSILAAHKSGEQAGLLVDFIHQDDASVIALSDGNCLIQSLDFFLPIVPKAYDFGRIAAANAISDIYAMGGRPITALSILGWPKDGLSLDLASEILLGAESVCKLAGITISGGHSIHSSEPLFGLSVNGMAKESEIKRNNTCKAGDLIYLSKPLGIGLMANALKHHQLSEEGYRQLIEVSTQLNALGIELGRNSQITAMTDVTGFGLLGHLQEMLRPELGATVYLDKIPVLDEAKELAMRMVYPDLSTSNFNAVKDRCEGLDGLEFLWLCDPQTSGGLLFTSNKEFIHPEVFLIGEITSSGKIQVR